MNENSDPNKKKRTRSRFGCRNCKRLKVKCDEIKPSCSLCLKSNKECDYSIQLTWGGRPFKKKKVNNYGFATISTFQQEFVTETKKSKSKSPTPQSSKALPEIQIQTQESFIVNLEANAKEKANARDQQPKQPQQIQIQRSNITPSTTQTSLDTSTAFPNTIEPVRSDYISEGNSRTAPDIPAKFDFQASEIFRDIETTNIAAKDFLNDCIIPELETFGNKYDVYAAELSPRIKELEENYEDLLDEESLVTRSLFSSVSQDQDSENDNHALVVSTPTNNQTQDMLTGYEFIPFSIVPLPDMLLKVPYFRENYHAYVEIYSKMIVPAPPSTYEDNPLTCIVPRMSLTSSTDGMLSVLIASSIVQGSHYRGENYPQEIVNMLIKRALNDLYERLTDEQEAESDYTLALIMVLACFEITCSEKYDWRSHYYGARRIILSRGLIKSSDDTGSANRKIVGFDLSEESDVTYFFARWFAYTDVIGSLSSSSLLNKTFNGNETHLIWEAPEITQKDKLNLKDIDPFMGFDLRLLKYFAEIVNLVKERERNCPTVDFLSATLIRKALEIKESMSKFLTESEVERTQVLKDIKEQGDEKRLSFLERYTILKATNRCFALAGILQIYRRILLMPAASTLVQELISEITTVFKNDIPVGTPAACCTIFSLFTSGCDAIDKETRAFYEERVLLLAKDGFTFGNTAYQLMIECWSTGKYWADLITEMDIDLTFV